MLKNTEGGTRRPRLFIDAADSVAEQGSNKPIAAALAARTKNHEQALKAAAAAAAKAAAADVITYFADDPPTKAVQQQGRGASDHGRNQKSLPSTNGLPELHLPAVEASSLPIDADAVLAEQAEAQDGINPLASLLGYSGDDGSGSEAGNDTPEREPSAEPREGPLAASDDNDSSIDADLASFMEELESSGLLKEGANDAGATGPGAEDPARQASTILEDPSTDTAPAQGAQDLAEGAADTAVAEPLGSAPEQAGQAETKGAQGEAAEQRVLGGLAGCPGWHEVMDMASGKVYFWNEESNEVAWDPPAGSEPRESGENEAVFAAAQASSAPQDSIQGQGSAPEPKHSRPVSAEQAAELDPARLSGPEAALDESMADAEDGELPAQSSLPKQPVDIPMPDEAIGEAAEELLARSWAAAEQLCGRAPLLVRLAVEAEVRARDWRALAARQRQAAERQDAAASLSWDAFQHSARADWERLQGALPGALRDAEAASTQAAAAVAAARQPRGASPEDGEVPQQKDGEAPPPLPADDGPSKVTAMAADIAAAHNAVLAQTPLPTSTLPAASQAQPSSSSSGPIATSLASVEQKGTLTALPQPQPAAAADLVAAQINSRVAAAASAQPAKASAAPSAAGAPLLARPPPGAAPLWPGYYHPTLPFPYAYQPYHYAPYPAAFLPPPWAAPRPAMPAAVPSSSVGAGEDTMDVESPPPLPQDEQPPLPSSAPAAAAADALPAPDAAGPSQPAKQREYRAEPVRAATPPAAAEAPVEPPGASNPAEESKKRKAKKAPAASVKRRAAVKVGSLAPAVLNKWAAARKDLEDKEAADEGTDADAAERRRAREAEEWRLKQLRSGVSSQANSNFQPLAMDWREKIKAAKGKPAEAPQAATAKPEPVKYASKPDLEALSGGLPPGWKALWDKKSGEVFYGNPATKETSWDKPD